MVILLLTPVLYYNFFVRTEVWIPEWGEACVCDLSLLGIFHSAEGREPNPLHKPVIPSFLILIPFIPYPQPSSLLLISLYSLSIALVIAYPQNSSISVSLLNFFLLAPSFLILSPSSVLFIPSTQLFSFLILSSSFLLFSCLQSLPSAPVIPYPQLSSFLILSSRHFLSWLLVIPYAQLSAFLIHSSRRSLSPSSPHSLFSTLFVPHP